ncbi:hypothetical protein QYE76_058232 [Lolium multiflorum]|uniref:Uncharacterized protein n=1 Tax=Lolium multiflorum TaxID=4521 RepID=A0AAD8WRF5_LOLMU|nr:hypothetical protein QYE76_058232 [Lolium multiflorum]
MGGGLARGHPVHLAVAGQIERSDRPCRGAFRPPTTAAVDQRCSHGSGGCTPLPRAGRGASTTWTEAIRFFPVRKAVKEAWETGGMFPKVGVELVVVWCDTSCALLVWSRIVERAGAKSKK